MLMALKDTRLLEKLYYTVNTCMLSLQCGHSCDSLELKND